jgi:hypothetical protein
MRRHALGELAEEEIRETNPEAYPPEGAWDEPNTQPSMYARFYERHPELKPAPKVLLKNLGPEIAPDGTRSGEILERLQHQVEALSKSVEDTDQKIGDLLLKANKCTNQACREFGKLHIHMEG